MSHFSVLVAVPNNKDLDEVMLPYHEAESTGFHDYCIWDDSIHDEYLKEYSEGTTPIVLKNGKQIGSKYDRNNEEIKSMWNRSIEFGWSSNDEFILKDGYDLVDLPFAEVYPTFDEFMKDYHGITSKNPNTGKYARFTNPNAK